VNQSNKTLKDLNTEIMADAARRPDTDLLIAGNGM